MDDAPPIELWGVSADLLHMIGGHRNIAFRTIGRQQNLVFKSTSRKPTAIEWLLPVHDLARKSGLVIPRIVRSCRGSFVESGWTCEEFVEGRPFSTEETRCIREKIERFHSLAAAVPQRPDQASSQDLLDLPAGGDIDLDAMPPDLAEACRTAWSGLADYSFTIVHGDLNSANMIRCPDGKIALVDWDECRRDLSVFDTGYLDPIGLPEQRALLAWEIACSWKPEPDYAKKTAGLLSQIGTNAE